MALSRRNSECGTSRIAESQFAYLYNALKVCTVFAMKSIFATKSIYNLVPSKTLWTHWDILTLTKVAVIA